MSSFLALKEEQESKTSTPRSKGATSGIKISNKKFTKMVKEVEELIEQNKQMEIEIQKLKPLESRYQLIDSSNLVRIINDLFSGKIDFDKEDTDSFRKNIRKGFVEGTRKGGGGWSGAIKAFSRLLVASNRIYIKEK